MLGRLRRFLSVGNDNADSHLPGVPKSLPSPPYDSCEFESILEKIRSGQDVRSFDLLRFLSIPRKAHRQVVNHCLAEAFFDSGRIEQAKVFVKRSWVLSEFSESVLPLFLRIHETARDSSAIREAYKRIGLSLINKNLSPALYYFGLSHYADSHLHCIDKFEYDFDMLDAVERAAQRYMQQVQNISSETSGDKIRIGYLLKGITDVNSILVRHIMTLVKYSNSSKFEVSIFCPESQGQVFSSAQGAANVSQFKKLGAKVYMAPDKESPDIVQMLLETAKQIRISGIDVLVTSAGLSDFCHYFLVCLKLAKVTVGLVQGPPAQFAPPNLDWCISWSTHPQIDTPVDCSLVQFSSEEYAGEALTAVSRKDLELPESACVLISSGRAAKFQDVQHWTVMKQILEEYPDVFYLIVGSTREYVKCFDSVMPDEVKSRIRFLGWRSDVLSILPAADIIVDTYPSGGGQSLIEGMLCGLPLVAHRNDYFALFDQNNWSPVEDLVDDLETVVDRGDFDAFKLTLSRLIEDREYRKGVGEQCLRKVRQGAGSGCLQDAVVNCEKIYLEVLNRSRD